MLDLGELIQIVPEDDYDVWNNTYSPVDKSTLPVYRVKQVSLNMKKKIYWLAVENIDKPGHIDYISSPESRVERVPAYKDGTPVRKN
jgi:hypothetical protein